VEFLTPPREPLRAIDGVSFDIAKGEVLGVVGESGAGKSVTGLAVIGLIDPPGRISGGEIYLSGMRIDHLPPEGNPPHPGQTDRHDLSGSADEPQSALQDRATRIVETIRTHTPIFRKVPARKRGHRSCWPRSASPLPEKAHRCLPARILRRHAASASSFALAICAEPELIIADEPTTALGRVGAGADHFR